METKQNQNKPKRKRKCKYKPSLQHIIFPLLLASIKKPTTENNSSSNNNNNKIIQSEDEQKLQLRLLNRLHLSLKPDSSLSTLLPSPVLSLLPSLLSSQCAEVVCKCAKFVGAASLYSLEMNHQIANDEEVVKSLVSGLACRRIRNTLIASCNAVLDLATTSFGQRCLLDCSALNCTIACFLQVSKSSVPPEVTTLTEDNGNEIGHKIGFKEDELIVLLIGVAITLINRCHIEHLEKIPIDLFEPFWACMKNLWKATHTQILYGHINKLKKQRHFSPSNITTSDLAECIFKLSMNTHEINPYFPLDKIKRSIFGQYTFENFISIHWENSPLLMRGSLKTSNDRNDLLNSFRQCLNFNNASSPSNSSEILKNLISCPPLASDDLNILNFLNETTGHLGSPMVYQQDIRVLKTSHLSGETHFFRDSQVFYIDDALRCEEAFKECHTIALRGMEFRFANIASVVDELASLFGQPSAGANMYLTPPNSQGLARHYDDHCVFVCQLIGAKKWKVFPQLSLLLPRLYEPVSLDEGDELSTECNQFLLREGDILYIPRGFLHEACTIRENDKSEEEVEFSLHLTLAIEVEAPFEWEGFAHIALHNWFQNQHQYLNSSPASLCHTLNVISMNLMHMAIKLIGDDNTIFRKACLVGAAKIPFLSDGQDMPFQNQKTIFSHLIKTIDVKSSFSDALQNMTLSLARNEDPFRKLRWLQNVENGDDIFELQNWRNPPGEKSFILICNELKEKVQSSFMFLKSKFCNEVDYEESVKCYSGLLEKYRKVRKQYKKGMLSLHHN